MSTYVRVSITIHPQGNINVCKKFDSNLFNIIFKLKVEERSSELILFCNMNG